MSTTRTMHELNRELANRINVDALGDPQSPYAGKFVGLANGQVVVISEDAEEMLKRLRQIEPDSAKTFWVEASRDYSEVHEIWSAL